MKKQIHSAKIIPLHQDTSRSVLEFLFKNLTEIEKDLDCILYPDLMKIKEKENKETA